VTVYPHEFAGVLLVDPRGRLLLQERDEHPAIDPDKWGLVGGHLEPSEDAETGAYRELEEETGVRLEPGRLAFWQAFEIFHEAYDTLDRMSVFVAPTTLGDGDIDCREGRQIVFVDPGDARGLDLTVAAGLVVPAFLDSEVYATMLP
jgi:8-oxo-dGTP pyrophosphatase MutT (NUDIX family)